LDKYNEFGGPGGKLGLPTSDELVNPDNIGRRTSFQNDASIYWSPATDAHQLGGEIGAKWCQLGCESVLGYPTSDELVNPDNIGRRNSFQNDVSIYWSPATGAHSIGGAIGAEWAARGYEGGGHGYPTTDELPNGDGVGRRNIFQGGSIYYHPSTGAHTIWGALRDNWASRNYENGRFGYPTSNEFSFEGGWAQNFQNGTIDWRPGDPANPADAAPPTMPREYAEYDPTGGGVDVTADETLDVEVLPNVDETPIAEEAPSADVQPRAEILPGETDPDGDPIPEIGCRINVANPHDSRLRDGGLLKYPAEIHTQVKSTCPSVSIPSRHLVKASGYRLRWWGVPQILQQIPQQGKTLVDGGTAAQNVSTSRTMKVVSAVSCEPGTRFRYKTIGTGEYTFPNGKTDRKSAFNDNPPGGELPCNTN
jgi:hypothetical protein